jgi:hypothetical protein
MMVTLAFAGSDAGAGAVPVNAVPATAAAFLAMHDQCTLLSNAMSPVLTPIGSRQVSFGSRTIRYFIGKLLLDTEQVERMTIRLFQ